MTQSLGDRMRGYVDVTNTRLISRTPVVIQVDGWHFHTITKGMNKPFDENLIASMWDAATFMVENIGGARLAYVQSDEISILITNYQNLVEEPWFDFRVQKLVSISASLATAGFNFKNRTGKLAMFDGRAFNLDPREVVNWFVFRQQDWTRNSIQMVAQSMFSQKELNGKNQDEMQDMMYLKNGTNWNDLPTYLKRGACIKKNGDGKWAVDKDIPIFSKCRGYIDELVVTGDDL